MISTPDLQEELMVPYTHNRQQPAWTLGSNPEREAATPEEQAAQDKRAPTHQAEQAALAVMHPDHHDPDWRYYFGAMAG
jgi:hypothetical protein